MQFEWFRILTDNLNSSLSIDFFSLNRKKDNDDEGSRKLSQFWRDDISRNVRPFRQISPGLFPIIGVTIRPRADTSLPSMLAFRPSLAGSEWGTKKCRSLPRLFLNRRYEKWYFQRTRSYVWLYESDECCKIYLYMKAILQLFHILWYKTHEQKTKEKDILNKWV